MTFRKHNQSGNTNLTLIIGVLLIAIIGLGGWMYLNKAAPDKTASNIMDAAMENNAALNDAGRGETLLPEEGEKLIPEETQAEESSSSPVEEPEVQASSPVTINMDEFMAPRTSGNPSAPIKIIEYASLTCSHCAHFYNDIYPVLKTKYIDTGKVFFEYREFPLNDPALKGSIAARCLPKDKFEGFLSLLFKTQENWGGDLNYMASLKQNAKLAGLSEERFDACQSDANIKLAIADSMQKAQEKWKINATPTFIINDGAEIISGALPLEEFERVFRKVSNGAVGEVPKVE